MVLAGQFIAYVLLAYEFVLIVRVVMSWVLAASPDWTPRGPTLVLSEVVYTVTDPPIKLVGRVVKPVRLGRFALDLSVIVVFVIIGMLMRLNAEIFF
ncbi:MAG: YggT family protein [Propionibacteriaceae bacterium]|jgi:YggT family protein|nr:YggT family protein [Propionibacteriaceae bacterium]